MKIYLTFAILLIFSCGPKVSQNTSILKNENSFKNDTLKYVILSLQDNKYISEDSNAKPFNLTSYDIMVLDSLLLNFTKIFNEIGLENYQEVVRKNPSSKVNIQYFIIDINNYKKQYLPYMNSDNHKLVFSNYFCKLLGDHNWKKYVITVSDGGICYFRLYINLTEKKITSFMVNDSP